MKLPLLLVIAFLPVASAVADDSSSLAGYHLKNRSTFDAGGVKRPPFWPIGWVHQARGVQEQPKVAIDAKMFSVTSILLGSPSLAVINGRTYGEGDLIRSARLKSSDTHAAPAGGGSVPSNARIRVQRIADGTVTLVCDEQTVVVPLKRPELNEHKSDKEAEDALLSGQ